MDEQKTQRATSAQTWQNNSTAQGNPDSSNLCRSETAPSAPEDSTGVAEPDKPPRNRTYKRKQVVALLHDFLNQDALGPRSFAAKHRLPYSTFLRWLRQRKKILPSLTLPQFFATPDGLRFLNRITTAAQIHISSSGPAGVRKLQAFYRDASLSPFVASSFGSLQRRSVALENSMLDFGKQETTCLAPTMPKRDISLGIDENFHRTDRQPNLVAVEPVSGFIVAECPKPKRDAKTWEKVIDDGLKPLQVNLIQVVGDGAKAFETVAIAKDIHRSPDLMHVQQPLHQACSLALSSQVEAAKEDKAKAQAKYEKVMKEHPDASTGKADPEGQKKFEAASKERSLTQAREERCLKNAQKAKEAIRGFGDDYHPFGAKGNPVQPQELEKKLNARLHDLKEVVEDANLSGQARVKIGRVGAMVALLMGTLAWFWLSVTKRCQKEGWTGKKEKLFKEDLLSWAYWQAAKGKGRNAQERKERVQLAHGLWLDLQENDQWKALSAVEQAKMLAAAKEMADRFQRSSSCVEGRNGRLSLKHHAKQGLTDRALKVLTVLHNFHIKRSDGTTAAERFFGRKHANLIDYLCDRLPDVSKPARSRKAA